MAQIDFSNAHIEPVYSPVYNARSDVALNPDGFCNASGNFINRTTMVKTVLVNETNKLVYHYTGSVSDSGTILYFGTTVGTGTNTLWWKFTNVSYNAGDTYDFKISANII